MFHCRYCPCGSGRAVLYRLRPRRCRSVLPAGESVGGGGVGHDDVYTPPCPRLPSQLHSGRRLISLGGGTVARTDWNPFLFGAAYYRRVVLSNRRPPAPRRALFRSGMEHSTVASNYCVATEKRRQLISRHRWILDTVPGPAAVRCCPVVCQSAVVGSGMTT